MKLKKIDRRMNGFGDFQYKVGYLRYHDRYKFIEIRNWCWEQWGPSCEYEFWKLDINPSWCWIIDRNELRILLASTKEAQWYSLKWG